MSIFIDPHDPRGPKAVALATQALAAGWPSLRAFYMPSSTNPNRVYVTTRAFCTCPAFMYDDRRAVAEGRPTRPCKHALAVALLDELERERAAF